MRNVNKELRNAIEAAKLEIELKTIIPEIDKILIKVETYTSCISSLYDNEKYKDDFIAEMQMKQADLLRLVNKLNDIAMHAMAINDRNIVFQCEEKKTAVRNVMEFVRNLYM